MLTKCCHPQKTKMNGKQVAVFKIGQEHVLHWIVVGVIEYGKYCMYVCCMDVCNRVWKSNKLTCLSASHTEREGHKNNSSVCLTCNTGIKPLVEVK